MAELARGVFQRLAGEVAGGDEVLPELRFDERELVSCHRVGQLVNSAVQAQPRCDAARSVVPARVAKRFEEGHNSSRLVGSALRSVTQYPVRVLNGFSDPSEGGCEKRRGRPQNRQFGRRVNGLREQIERVFRTPVFEGRPALNIHSPDSS